MSETREKALLGHWIHSHEEDTEATMVFRPAGFSFPPSRGRTSFELRADGSYAGSAPGPADAPEPTGGRWSLSGDRLLLDGGEAGHSRSLEVAAVESDRLLLRRP